MIIPQTAQTPIISMQSTEQSMLSTVTTTSFPQISTTILSVANNDENIINNKTDRNELHSSSDLSQTNESKSDSNITSNTSGPLLPPPLPPFQPPLIPPLPAIISGQPPPRMPWLSGPPPPILPTNRMPGLNNFEIKNIDCLYANFSLFSI